MVLLRKGMTKIGKYFKILSLHVNYYYFNYKMLMPRVDLSMLNPEM